MIVAVVIIVLIVALTITLWIKLSQAVFELTLDGTNYGITNAYGLDLMKPSISMDFKMKPLSNDINTVGLFCIGARGSSPTPSKKYYVSMNTSVLNIRVFVQKEQNLFEKNFEQSLNVDYFDDTWHTMSVWIDIAMEKIIVKFDDRPSITINDDTGKYPLGSADKAYIGGIADGYIGVGIMTNIKFGNVLKPFKP